MTGHPISLPSISLTKLSESGRGGRTIGALIDEAVDILSSNQYHRICKEVAYCSANLLLCAFSAELYNKGECLFMDYLHISSKAGLSQHRQKNQRYNIYNATIFLTRVTCTRVVSPSDTQASKSALLTLSKFREGAEGMSHGEGVNTISSFFWSSGCCAGSDSHPVGKDRNGELRH